MAKTRKIGDTSWRKSVFLPAVRRRRPARCNDLLDEWRRLGAGCVGGKQLRGWTSTRFDVQRLSAGVGSTTASREREAGNQPGHYAQILAKCRSDPGRLWRPCGSENRDREMPAIHAVTLTMVLHAPGERRRRRGCRGSGRVAAQIGGFPPGRRPSRGQVRQQLRLMPFSGAPCREAGSAGEQDAGARHTARAGVLVPARDSSWGSGHRPPACGADRRYRARLSCGGSGVISRARCRRKFSPPVAPTPQHE